MIKNPEELYPKKVEDVINYFIGAQNNYYYYNNNNVTNYIATINEWLDRMVKEKLVDELSDDVYIHVVTGLYKIMNAYLPKQLVKNIEFIKLRTSVKDLKWLSDHYVIIKADNTIIDLINNSVNNGAKIPIQVITAYIDAGNDIICAYLLDTTDAVLTEPTLQGYMSKACARSMIHTIRVLLDKKILPKDVDLDVIVSSQRCILQDKDLAKLFALNEIKYNIDHIKKALNPPSYATMMEIVENTPPDELQKIKDINLIKCMNLNNYYYYRNRGQENPSAKEFAGIFDILCKHGLKITESDMVDLTKLRVRVNDPEGKGIKITARIFTECSNQGYYPYGLDKNVDAKELLLKECKNCSTNMSANVKNVIATTNAKPDIDCLREVCRNHNHALFKLFTEKYGLKPDKNCFVQAARTKTNKVMKLLVELIPDDFGKEKKPVKLDDVKHAFNPKGIKGDTISNSSSDDSNDEEVEEVKQELIEPPRVAFTPGNTEYTIKEEILKLLGQPENKKMNIAGFKTAILDHSKKNKLNERFQEEQKKTKTVVIRVDDTIKKVLCIEKGTHIRQKDLNTYIKNAIMKHSTVDFTKSKAKK